MKININTETFSIKFPTVIDEAHGKKKLHYRYQKDKKCEKNKFF